DRVERAVLRERPLDDLVIRGIADDERRGRAGDPLDPLGDGRARVREVVQEDRLVSRLDEGDGRVGTDVAGTAGKKYAHDVHPMHDGGESAWSADQRAAST